VHSGAGEDAAGARKLDVMTWKEINPFLAQWMESVSSVIVIVYLIVYVAVAILILNAMLMAVFERIKEFGVLKAIGYGPFQVMGMILAEGMLQATVAMCIGLVIAAPGMWYLQTYGINVGVLGGIQMAGMTMPAVWQGHYSVGTSGMPVVLLFFVVFCAVIYPAIKAAWVKPVEAMHHT
jgi:ABC-type lipoprotein release transport system permease subunit